MIFILFSDNASVLPERLVISHLIYNWQLFYCTQTLILVFTSHWLCFEPV